MSFQFFFDSIDIGFRRDGAIAFSIMGTRTIIGYSLVFAAGVMTYITADELIPVAHEYGFKHIVSVGLLLGIIFALLVDVLLG